MDGGSRKRLLGEALCHTRMMTSAVLEAGLADGGSSMVAR
jgi:hypothetical protein